MDNLDRRHESRITLDSIILPFLGCREEDHTCFQYIPIDFSTKGCKIAVPLWVVNRERIQMNDVISVSSPFRLQGHTFYQGRVIWTKWDETMVSQFCGLTLLQEMPPAYPVFFNLDGSNITMNQEELAKIDDCILELFKDIVLLKRGASIYFKHLIPYFSRITGYSTKEYPQLKNLLLSDIQYNIINHINSLTDIFDIIKSSDVVYKNMVTLIDLEFIRTLIESEINIDLLSITFDSQEAHKYLISIKELENKLYANYNNLVMIHVMSLLNSTKV